MDSLVTMTNEVVHDAMLESSPRLVAAIRDTLQMGQTPAQIESTMRRRFGNTQMVRNVRHVAEHLARTTKR